MILLDTHVVLWLVIDPEKLSRRAAAAIRRARAGDGIAVADITLLELATLFARGSVRYSGTLERALREIVEVSSVCIRPVTPEIAALALQFSGDYPRDPSDRLIGATARAEGIPLVTRDEKIRSSPLLNTIW